MKLYIVGKVPPPIGGVTIHISRLLNNLKDHNIFCGFIDYKNIWNYRYFFMIGGVYHIHLSNKWMRLFFVFVLKFLLKRVIVTFHGKYDFSHKADLLALQLCDEAILLNNFTYNAAKNVKDKGIHLIGAFIPPKELNPLKPALDLMIEKLKKDVDILCCLNASVYAEDESGCDIYMGAEVIDFFNKNRNIGLIFSDPSGMYSERFVATKPDNVIFIVESHDFVSVLLKSDVFIRATRKDGDSISVKEALYFNKKVIATGCVDRPMGVLIINDINEIGEKINEKHFSIKPVDNFEQILGVYKKYILS
ncbi:conserved hypothetical protein [Sphingobacterium sp. PM2-P1-29]|nr:conserved hypothetical protein [Sphingobacterium sp. PM2-P1-29]